MFDFYDRRLVNLPFKSGIKRQNPNALVRCVFGNAYFDNTGSFAGKVKDEFRPGVARKRKSGKFFSCNVLSRDDGVLYDSVVIGAESYLF